jgi:VanZ family protein
MNDAAVRPAPLALRGAWLAAGWLMVALVIWLSVTPNPPPPGVVYGFDAAHAAAYATLMFWFAQLYAATPVRVALAIAFVALGVGLEIAQGFLPNREMNFADMRDNSAGVAIGWLLAATALRRVLPAIDAQLAAVLRRG